MLDMNEKIRNPFTYKMIEAHDMQTAWCWRLWGIRHVRYFWHAIRLMWWVSTWNSVGIGWGGPSEYDCKVLEDIWKGKA
jgi:hypothetical protein